MDWPKIIAHRGISAHAPENTFAAFNLCVSEGIQWLECDITFSLDEVPIVFHDKTLKRQTN